VNDPEIDLFSSVYSEIASGVISSSIYFTGELTVKFNAVGFKLVKVGSKWKLNNIEYDKVIFCGNLKHLSSMLFGSLNLSAFTTQIDDLEYHGTTSVLCEIESNDYSWVYLPDAQTKAHRIICTGNFSESNNGEDKLTATIEFTDEVSEQEILEDLKKIPFNPKYISHRYTKYTYPIQNQYTKALISELKELLEPRGIYLLGRFAEWEYYNMDAAIGASLDLNQRLKLY
jgi:UDP-galactopyranose mutase